jgi:hypothetical protein
MKEKLYKVYGKINGKWKCLSMGGVSKSSAEFQAALQSAFRRCETKIKPA